MGSPPVQSAPHAGVSVAVFALLTATTLLLGCAAELDEGIFGCADGGGCPDGWRCLADDRCYSPSFAGFDLLARCDVDEDCASGLCVRAYDETASTGRCSEACPSPANCSAVAGETMVCAPNVGCLEGCDSAADCSDPSKQKCVVAPMTPGTHACVEFASTDFSGRRHCTSPADCEFGLLCMRATAEDNVGICVWPCSPGGPCPLDATCEAMPSFITSVTMNPQHACISPCDNLPNSCGNAMLSCAPFPNTMRHCAPTGWVD